MPRGDKKSYSSKQKRQAAHIEKSYRQRGKTSRTAKARAWATVNKQDGGARKKGGARRKTSAGRKSSTARKSGGRGGRKRR